MSYNSLSAVAVHVKYIPFHSSSDYTSLTTFHIIISAYALLSCASSTPCAILSMFRFFRSFSIHDNRVVRWPPLYFEQGPKQWIKALNDPLSLWILEICPKNRTRRFLILILQGIWWVSSYRVSFESQFPRVHRMLRILRRIWRWNTSIALSRGLVTVHTSELYRKIDSMSALKMRSLVSVVRCWSLKIGLMVANVHRSP